MPPTAVHEGRFLKIVCNARRSPCPGALPLGSGQASLLGKFTSNTDDQYVLVGSNGFSWTGTGTIVAANGDKLFTSVSGTGTFGTPIHTMGVTTITGGTGRFADATGTLTGTSATTSVSIVGSIEMTTQTGSSEGTISY